MNTLSRLPVSLLFFALLLTLLLITPVSGSTGDTETRGIKIRLKDGVGIEESVALYKGSYALLIGVSRYNAGWPMLEAIPSEINLVESVLKTRGFHVVKILDPDSKQLESAYETFINTYGLDKENRLLFFYSGHGYTRKDGQKGYLVPIDAPDPEKDLTGFLQKALGMNQVLSWARDIESKHALFLFDSCFSGTIFKQRSRLIPPRHITRMTIEPVRQFITAGSAGEEVPANSTFTPAFVDALRYGLADLNKDGYVSATELGLYLQTEVPAHVDQNPQFGKIKDYDLSRGDFIFMTDATLEFEDVKAGKKVPYSTAEKRGILKINSTPEGASVYIDNEFQGSTPITLADVAPGTRSLRVDKKGYRTEAKQIEITPGRHITIAFPLVERISGGTLTIETTPVGTTIKIADFKGSYTPGMRISAGSYSIEISKVGHVTETVRVQIRENEDLHINVILKRDTAVVSPDNQEIEQGAQATDVLPTISPEKKKMASSKGAVIPKNIQVHINQLHSSNARNKRDAAKVIYRQQLRHPAVMEAVERELLDGYNTNLRDKYHVDAMAWLCKVLGSTRQSKYSHSLNKVANSTKNRKIRKYALKNLQYLK